MKKIINKFCEAIERFNAAAQLDHDEMVFIAMCKLSVG